LARTLALWFALAVLGLAHAAGFGIWPRRSMTASDALLALALAGIAFLPHVACTRLGHTGLTTRRDRSRRLHAAA
jgi:hypothetical protein